MKLGLIGLGKMGYHLALNFLEHGHEVAGTDTDRDAVARLVAAGGQGHHPPQDLVKALTPPRVVWLMVPAGDAVDAVLHEIAPHLAPGDIVIDGGNSHYEDSIRRSDTLARQGIHYFDVGTSGGIEGARHGACYMIGGPAEVFPVIEPLFRDTAVPGGYLYTGPAGSGHFAKMVHNGIEYGMMAAIGEGFEVLVKSRFRYDLAALAQVWNHGSVIRGWLMELTARAFGKDPWLESIRGVMHSSGEGKWTVEEALRIGVPVPVIALSLMMRYRSLETDTFTGRVVAALRREFGGHAVEPADTGDEDEQS